jgi:hypothetical protein
MRSRSDIAIVVGEAILQHSSQTAPRVYGFVIIHGGRACRLAMGAGVYAAKRLTACRHNAQ